MDRSAFAWRVTMRLRSPVSILVLPICQVHDKRVTIMLLLACSLLRRVRVLLLTLRSVTARPQTAFPPNGIKFNNTRGVKV